MSAVTFSDQLSDVRPCPFIHSDTARSSQSTHARIDGYPKGRQKAADTHGKPPHNLLRQGAWVLLGGCQNSTAGEPLRTQPGLEAYKYDVLGRSTELREIFGASAHSIRLEELRALYPISYRHLIPTVG